MRSSFVWYSRPFASFAVAFLRGKRDEPRISRIHANCQNLTAEREEYGENEGRSSNDERSSKDEWRIGGRDRGGGYFG